MLRTGQGFRVAIGVPPGGLGGQLPAMRAWLEREAGSEGYSMRIGAGPAGTRALHLDLRDERLARAFVRRWVLAKVEIPARSVTVRTQG
jgi:hypothetical protein